ncbi:MAG: MBL fold metallo-hydrolase [Candidatus Thalassarchaeaceae archaeon]|nr:MBL fold metallo-hydrolase [Candidatus Thalassarchaeaceae archaeon]
MSELPRGVELPPSEVTTPRPSASAMLSREHSEGHEILLGHRVSELPAFPDLWSFPGGSISRVDKHAAQTHPEWLSERGDDRLSAFALLREMVEEIGIAPDGKGGFVEVSSDVRELVCNDKSGWLEAMESGSLTIEDFHCDIITVRTTPPQAPERFHNLFFHVPTEGSGILPSFPPGLSEFDEFRWWRPVDLLSSWEDNEVHLPPPIITIIRDLVEAVGEKGDLLSACDYLAADPPSGPHRFEYSPGVECTLIPTKTLPPSTHTNCFVLGERGGQRVIVDAAARSDEAIRELALKVQEIWDDGSSIIATIFTHRHHDHIGDLNRISELYTAPIWAGEQTFEAVPASDSDRILSEGDFFVLEGPNGEVRWDVIESPGHCPGQICLVSETGIISGDNCTMVGTILVPSDEGDMGAYISGLERLRALSPKMLFPGHGPHIANPERVLTHFIEHRKARHRRVLEAVREGNSDIPSIAEAAYSDSPEAHPMLARDQALSHLRELERTGHIESDGNLYMAI